MSYVLDRDYVTNCFVCLIKFKKSKLDVPLTSYSNLRGTIIEIVILLF